jgi:hypothetical protein
MNGSQSWMLYGAAGHTGALIARHAQERGHRPLLAGRNAPAVAALAGHLGLPHRALALDDPATLAAALDGVDLVLNAAGPFLHTAAPLAEACLRAGVHYLDIGNELQVFAALYELHQRAELAGVAIIPGVGFGVVATNCLARYVSEAVGGAQHLEVAARAATARPGPGIAASIRENLPYGGWTRQNGHLHPQPLGSGITTIPPPTGPAPSCPSPPETWKQPSRPPALPPSPRIPRYQPIPPPPIPTPQIQRLPDPRPTGPSGGPGPPARTARAPRRGWKPASPTPSPPRPASAPSRKPSPGPRAGHSALLPRSARASS